VNHQIDEIAVQNTAAQRLTIKSGGLRIRFNVALLVAEIAALFQHNLLKPGEEF
jgi:hypothetical protein